MTAPPLLSLSVTGVYGRLTKGHSAPLLASAVTPADERVDVVVKLRSRIHGGGVGLAMELIAALLARDLGLPVPDPALAFIPPQLAGQASTETDRRDLASSTGLNFGCRHLSPASVLPVGPELPPALIDSAAATLAFDALVQNKDRHPDKPNCLLHRQEIVPVDHELAFPFILGDLIPPPWEHAGLTFLHRHVMFARLQGQLVDFTPIEQAAARLSPARLQSYRLAIPTEWQAARETERVVDFLMELQPRVAHVTSLLKQMLR